MNSTIPRNIQVQSGERITAHTPTFPSRRYWYRHDTVSVDGVTLEGYIQVRHRAGRTEVITCFRNSCVIGRAVEWLIKQNGMQAA